MKRIAVLTGGITAAGMNAAIRSIVRLGIVHGWASSFTPRFRPSSCLERGGFHDLTRRVIVEAGFHSQVVLA